MDIFKKLITAFRGGAREVGETIVDSQGTRIFEQEIHDAKDRLDEAKDNLTDVIAHESQAQRKVQLTKSQIKETENHVNEALDKNEEALALELAGKVAVLETQLEEEQGVVKSNQDNVRRLKELMNEAERQIADYERQLTMVKTTENVQKASAAINDTFASSDSNIRSARESLERIKKKQEHEQDRINAAKALEREANNTDLEDKMVKAGVGQTGPDANSVLERLKAKRK